MIREQLRHILGVSLKVIGMEMYSLSIWLLSGGQKTVCGLKLRSLPSARKWKTWRWRRKIAAVENQAEMNAIMREYLPDWPQEVEPAPWLVRQEGLILRKQGIHCSSWVKSENKRCTRGPQFPI